VASKSPGTSWLSELLSRRVEELAYRDFPVVGESSTVVEAAEMMRKHGQGAAVVRFSDGSLGIVTERDVLYKVVARGLDPRTTRVREIASRPLESVEEGTSMEEALSKMASKHVRRLGVVGKDGKLVGVLTVERMLGPDGAVILPIPEVPAGYMCPFCGSVFRTKEELSKHIDRVHIGLGLLEGNTSKW